MSNKLEISILQKLRREPLINAAKGILPVASTWGTPPTNLLNITDGDLATVSGTGTSTIGASTNFGEIAITMPEVGVYIVGGKIGSWSTVGSIGVRIYSTPDGVTQQFIGVISSNKAATTEVVYNVLPCTISGNTFSFIFNGSAAMTANVKIYSIWAFKIM